MAFSTNQQIFEAVEKSKDILIAFKKNYTGDSMGGAIALFLFLQKIGKRVDIVCDSFRIPAGYTFLPSIKEIKSELSNLRKFIISLDISRTKVDEISYDVKEKELDFIVSPKNGFFEESDISSKSSGFKYDLILIIDTPDLEVLGEIYDNDTEFFYKTPIINIDYSAANENFGQINSINLTAASTCDILFDILTTYNEELIDEDIATALLTGIITTTKNFKSNKVTPATLNIASRLIAAGARRSEIIQHLYQARSLATLKLWGRTLAHLKNDSKRKLVWSLVSRKDFTVTGAKEENLDDVVEELVANSNEVETVVIIYEKGVTSSANSKPAIGQSNGKVKPEQSIQDNDKDNIPSSLINASQNEKPESTKTNDESQNICVVVVSLKNINSLDLAKNFSGATGNDAKAKFCLTGLTLDQAEEKVIKEIRARLDEVGSKGE